MGRARSMRPYQLCSTLLVVFAVTVAVLLTVPENQYGTTEIERRVAAFERKCGYHDATNGVTEYSGTFDTDPGSGALYIAYGTGITTNEAVDLFMEISNRDQAEQSHIYKVFARAYHDGYDEGSTWFG